MPDKSKGHLCFRGDWEYFRFKDSIYRVHVDKYIGTDGYRVSARFWSYDRPDSRRELGVK